MKGEQGRAPVRTLVVDVTYRCNSPCRYCQWGSPELRKPDRPAAEVCLPPSTLTALRVEKVVFSGGEPALHAGLDSILRHDAGHVRERLEITNGLLRDEPTRERLWTAGATSLTFSIDSVDPDRFEANRGLPSKAHAAVLANLRRPRTPVLARASGVVRTEDRFGAG